MGIPIFVRDSIVNESILFEIVPTDTVLSLKQQIQNKQKYDVSQQQLVFCGRTLSDNETLQSYNVQKHATVHLMLKLGTEFVDVTRAKTIEIPAGTVGATWYYAGYGLNMCGKCKNTSCAAFNKDVIHKCGYNQFSLLKDKALCPQCSVEFKPESPWFYYCKYKWKIMKGVVEFEKPWASTTQMVSFSMNEMSTSGGSGAGASSTLSDGRGGFVVQSTTPGKALFVDLVFIVADLTADVEKEDAARLKASKTQAATGTTLLSAADHERIAQIVLITGCAQKLAEQKYLSCNKNADDAIAIILNL